MCAPIGLETEKGTRLLVHPSRAVEVGSRVLCIFLYDATWKKSGGEEESQSPGYPEPSLANVAISNSAENGTRSSDCTDHQSSLHPVTWNRNWECLGVHQKFTLIWNQVAGLRLAIRISVPGFAVLLTKLHSSCPFFLMERSCGWSKKIRTRTFAPPRKTVFHNRRNHRRRHRRQGLHHCRHANAPDERSSSSQRTPQTFQALAQMGPGMGCTLHRTPHAHHLLD